MPLRNSKITFILFHLNIKTVSLAVGVAVDIGLGVQVG